MTPNASPHTNLPNLHTIQKKVRAIVKRQYPDFKLDGSQDTYKLKQDLGIADTSMAVLLLDVECDLNIQLPLKPQCKTVDDLMGLVQKQTPRA